MYGDGWFEARVLEMTGGQVSDRFSLHPPTTSLLMVPIAWLDLTRARVVWQLFNLGLLAAALWLVIDAARVKATLWRVLFIAFALVYTPMAENFRVGQTYVLLLFLFALALWSQASAAPTERGRNVLTGIGLGLAAGLKLSGGPLWLLFIVRQQWRAVLWSGAVLMGASVVGLTLGWDGWTAFFGRVISSSQAVPQAAHVAYQTTPSFFQHLFLPSPDFNPMPLFDLPPLVPLLSLLAAFSGMGATLWFGRRARIELGFAATVTLSVILFPMALEYHYTLLLIPLAVMSAEVFDASSRLDAIWLGIVLILLYVPFDWNASRWNEGAWSLLAYPRLYGGWLLWLWLVREMLPSKQTRNTLPAHAPAGINT